MRCLTLVLLFTAAVPAFGQQGTVGTATRPVLKALPIGGDDDIDSRPVANRAVRPVTPMPKPAASVTAVPAAAVSTTIKSVRAPQMPGAVTIAPSIVPNPLNAKPTGDDALRLQIFLDEANFGPGVIDGKPGRFTDLAVYSWNEVNGHPIDDWTVVNAAARKAVPSPLAVAIVPDFAMDWVDAKLPADSNRAGQAKARRMSYRSVAEFMAERYHCDVPYLGTLNGAQKVDGLKPRESIIVPNVTPFHVEKLGGAHYEADCALSQRHVVVDTKINQVRIFEAAPTALIVAEPGSPSATTGTRANRGLVASFPITPGKPQFIKFGTWELRGMVELPWWRYDQQLLDTGKRSDNALNIPPGPNSPVGVIWNGTSKPGIGLHGTCNPETIGRARSSGCIRLANWDAIRLPNLVRPGATVEIR